MIKSHPNTARRQAMSGCIRDLRHNWVVSPPFFPVITLFLHLFSFFLCHTSHLHCSLSPSSWQYILLQTNILHHKFSISWHFHSMALCPGREPAIQSSPLLLNEALPSLVFLLPHTIFPFSNFLSMMLEASRAGSSEQEGKMRWCSQTHSSQG